MKWWGWLILLAVLGSVLPIWRVGGSKEGYTVWEVLGKTAEHKHLPVEEALRRAREAYWRRSLNRRLTLSAN